MSNKTFGILGMNLGALIVVSNLLVGFFGFPWLYDLVGFPAIGFGWRKITLIVLGLLLLIVGIILYYLANKLKKVEK